MEIRRSCDRLISTMGFPILVRRHLYIESGPWQSFGPFLVPRSILSDKSESLQIYKIHTYLWPTAVSVTHRQSSLDHDSEIQAARDVYIRRYVPVIAAVICRSEGRFSSVTPACGWFAWENSFPAAWSSQMSGHSDDWICDKCDFLKININCQNITAFVNYHARSYKNK